MGYESSENLHGKCPFLTVLPSDVGLVPVLGGVLHKLGRRVYHVRV